MPRAFSATDDFINHSDINAIDGAAALTVCLWALTDSTSQLGLLFGKLEAPGASANDLQFVQSTNAGSAAGDGLCVIIGTTSPRGGVGGLFADTTTSHHCAFVFDGAGGDNAARLKIYFDAVSQALSFSGTIPATLGSSANNVLVGAAFDVTRDYAGSIGHIKVWTAALTASEIAQEMIFGPPIRTANLILWAPYEGTTVRDFSGNGNHGSILNNPAISPVRFPVITSLAGPSLIL